MVTSAAIGSRGLSDADWQKRLADNEINATRQQQAREQALRLGRSYYSWTGPGGASGIGLIDKPKEKQEVGTGGNGNSASGGGLFGNGGNGLFGGNSFTGLYDSMADRAKDLARFSQDLNKEMGRFNRGLREEEFQADFGRNYKLAEQQITGTQALENIRQGATTQRLESQLANQLESQRRGFDQQNLFRAQSAALALRGLR